MNHLTRSALLAGAAFAALLAAPATAQDSREHALEARIDALEAALAGLRADLVAVHAEPHPAQSLAAPKVAAPAAAAPSAPSDGFQVGGTTIKLGGFFKTYAAFSRYSGGDIAGNTSGRDFYLPSATPVGAPSAGESFEGHVKQTRLVVSTSTPLGSHVIKGWLEMDFQTAPGTGNQRMTNAYNPGLRRAFVSFDNVTIGQDWTNFQYVAALPESTDFIGPSEGTVFGRQVQLRYAAGLSKHLTLLVAVENPATTTANAGSATIAENSNDRVPDLTARLNWTTSFGELSLAGLARELAVSNGTARDSGFAWGISAAGKMGFGAHHQNDLRFMVTHGEGIGRYVGLNLAPDAMLTTSGGALRLDPVSVTAGFVALRWQWMPALRSTVMGSYQTIGYPIGLAVPSATASSWSAAGNLFWSPLKPIDLGIELRHGVRTLVSGASGQLDRLEFAAKYNF